jgi:hypothetical protein
MLNFWQPLAESIGRIARDKLLLDSTSEGTAQDAMDMAPRARRQTPLLAVAPTSSRPDVVRILQVNGSELGERQIAERGGKKVSGNLP